MPINQNPSTYSLPRVTSAALVGALCWIPAHALAIAPADDLGKSYNEAVATLNSVVVSRDKVDVASRPALDDALEPIAQHEERELELAPPEQPREHKKIVEPRAIASEIVDEVAADKKPNEITATESAKSVTPADKNDIGNAYADQARPEPALFHGMQAGSSTKRELLAEWGEPLESAATETGELLTYDMQPFRQVDVLIENDVVTLMRVEFARLENLDDLRRKVRLDIVEEVELTDDATGHVLGYAFPERGMVFVLAGIDDVTPTEGDRIEQMLLQSLDAQAFTLRAERRPISAVSDNLRDLDQAIELDSENAHAYWLLAGTRLLIGQADAAHTAATQAVEFDPENSAYKLRVAQSLIELAQYDEAVLMIRALLDDKNVPDNTRALAFHEMGRLAALGEADIADKAIGFHTTAIGLADKLASSGDQLERRAAKRLLVSAHMAIAQAVSRRDFENKIDSMSQWVGRASGIAEEAIESGDSGQELRLEVACESLAALVNIKPARDPQPLIKEIKETFDAIKAKSNDPLWLNEIEWRMGVAYTNAVQMEHHRREMARALKYKEEALKHFAKGAEVRRSAPDTERLVGRLYFHIGALHAVHGSDHAKAVIWYDKAEPMLTSERPLSTLYVPRRDGEALVSMAVSYWDQDDFEHAVELTEKGAKVIELAVAGGVVEESTLAVPYGNLSVMHKQLGNTTAALKFAKLADASKKPATTGQQAAKPLPQPPATTTSNGQVTTGGSRAPATTAPNNQPARQANTDRTANRSQVVPTNNSTGQNATNNSRRRPTSRTQRR